jgi:hypothetical protein
MENFVEVYIVSLTIPAEQQDLLWSIQTHAPAVSNRWAQYIMHWVQYIWAHTFRESSHFHSQRYNDEVQLASASDDFTFWPNNTEL